jgi:hypothetical protein
MIRQAFITGCAILALTACTQPKGVGLGVTGAGGDGVTGPQSTRTEFEMAGLQPLPIYRFNIAGAATPAQALNVGGTRLREEAANLQITAESRTYFMRQI